MGIVDGIMKPCGQKEGFLLIRQETEKKGEMSGVVVMPMWLTPAIQ
jgi:hypothetical protein